MNEKQYEIKDLHRTIDDYKFISKFDVTTMYQEDVDIFSVHAC
jgi:hypothetical protein